MTLREVTGQTVSHATPPLNSQVKNITPSLSVFGERAFKEVSQAKRGPKGETLTRYTAKKRGPGSPTHGEKATKDGEKAAVCRPRREASGESNPAALGILDSKPRERRENKCVVLS